MAIGEYRSVSVLGVKFLFDDIVGFREQLEEVMDFVSGYEGEVLDFNRERLFAVFGEEVPLEVLEEDFGRGIGEKYRVVMRAAKGDIEVGSVGMEDYACLVGVGELFEELQVKINV